MTKCGREKNKKKPRTSSERKDEFLAFFAREAPSIRESIVKDLPAFNALLSMQAMSFDEFALQQLADRRGIPRGSAATIVPPCPSCKTDNGVGKKEAGIYRCRTCGRTFSPNFESISSGTKCDALTWMKVLQCILDSVGITKTCEYCDISETTYYKIRNRLFYGMQLMMDEVKLSGLELKIERRY